jgi:predicted AAA+ superfamily ATPase
MQDAENESIFLFGARQTGKTTFLKQRFPEVRYYDLLKADVLDTAAATAIEITYNYLSLNIFR